MGRPPRADYPNLCHHVMARGNNKAAIFLDAEDYSTFQELLAACVKRFRILLQAYCLMPNHVHLLPRTTDGNLSNFMGRLLGGYARKFNRRYRRVGHAFQGRFRSKLVLKNNYMIELTRYIHMNPVKAGIVTRPERHPWSSFPALFGRPNPVPIDKGLYEERFPGPSGPRDLYRFTIARRVPDADSFGWPTHPAWYAGAPVEKPSPPPAAATPDPHALLKEIARRYACTLERLTGGWRNPRLGAARAAAMLALRDQCGLPLARIASLLHLRNTRSICNALHRAVPGTHES